MNTLPAGLLDTNQEIFASEMKAYSTVEGKVVPFAEFSESVIIAAEEKMLMQPRKYQAYQQMVGVDRLLQIERFLVCSYGGFDNTADIIEGQLQATEYWACPNRGKCEFEGIGCDSLKTDSGHFLTKQEIVYIKLTADGMLDKEIASEKGIALSTVTTHSRNVRLKTGLSRKADITRFAFQKNLV